MKIKFCTFCFFLIFGISNVNANQATSPNFNVTSTDSNAGLYAEQLEKSRTSHYTNYLNDKSPKDWPNKVDVKITVTDSNGGGETSFMAGKMWCKVQGSKKSLIEDVLPHECFHMVAHQYFNAVSLPRWWDEGIASSCESMAYQVGKYDLYLYNKLSLNKSGGYPTAKLWNFKEYPSDVMGFYGQAHSQIQYLESIHGKIELINFMSTYLEKGANRALLDHYGFASTTEFEKSWLKWIPQYQKACDVHWNEQTGKWECGGGGLLNLNIGTHQAGPTLPPPTINPQSETPTPTPVPQQTPVDITQITNAVAQLTTFVQSAINNQQVIITDLATKLGQSQDSVANNFNKINGVLTKIADVNQKIANSPITPVVEQTASWILPLILSATGMGGLSGLLLFLNGILKRRSAAKIVTNLAVLKGGVPSTGTTFPVAKLNTGLDPNTLITQLIGLIKNQQGVPANRDLSEAISTLQLSQNEGRSPVLDAIVGRISEDKIMNLIQGTDPQAAATATALLKDITDTVNSLAPLSTKQ